MNRRSDASEENAGVASIGFFVNVQTFLATLASLHRKFANVLRMSVFALFL